MDEETETKLTEIVVESATLQTHSADAQNRYLRQERFRRKVREVPWVTMESKKLRRRRELKDSAPSRRVSESSLRPMGVVAI